MIQETINKIKAHHFTKLELVVLFLLGVGFVWLLMFFISGLYSKR